MGTYWTSHTTSMMPLPRLDESLVQGMPGAKSATHRPCPAVFGGKIVAILTRDRGADTERMRGTTTTDNDHGVYIASTSQQFSRNFLAANATSMQGRKPRGIAGDRPPNF